MTQLTFTPEPLNKRDGELLIQWLGHRSTDLAVAHVKGKIAQIMIVAANDLHDSEGKPNAVTVGQEKLQEAKRYEEFLKVLDELRSTSEFETLKIHYE